jgi:hypothetical protein
MSSNNNRITWRQREAEKNRLAKAKHIAKTEENFPSTLASTVRAIVHEGPGMAERILEAHIQEEVRRRMDQYRASTEARERRDMVNGVFLFRKSRGGYQDDEVSEEGSYIIEEEERYPGHGKRGTYTDADNDGWRIVTKRLSRKRELTDAEMERKWRSNILNEEEEQEQADYNGELSENGQRREFY